MSLLPTRYSPSFIFRILAVIFIIAILPRTLRALFEPHGVSSETRILPSWATYKGSGSKVGNGKALPPITDPNACPPADKLDDILVVMKTGSSEILEKLPVHFRTTLRCIPHLAIFSDLAEEVEGRPVMDVLEGEYTNETREAAEEFRVYERLQAQGRGAISAEEIERWQGAENTVFGKTDNLGWKLDKWKFVPMIAKAYEYKRDAKWFVFIEADSYINWWNMVAWLDNFDPVKKLYLGEQMQIGDVVFAYGGTGYVLSNPAIRKALKYRKANMEAVEQFTRDEWAGDMILGWMLAQAGVELSWSWPNLQGQLPNDSDYFGAGWDRRQWCYAAVSYHHMKAEDIEQLDHFERHWEGPVRYLITNQPLCNS